MLIITKWLSLLDSHLLSNSSHQNIKNIVIIEMEVKEALDML